MTFEIELVPEEEKARIESISQFSRLRPDLWKWTVDRDRDICMYQVHKYGGGYEGTEVDRVMAIEWSGDLITFWVTEMFEPIGEREIRTILRIHNVHNPSDRSTSEVMSVISEALMAKYATNSSGVSVSIK